MEESHKKLTDCKEKRKLNKLLSTRISVKLLNILNIAMNHAVPMSDSKLALSPSSFLYFTVPKK